MKEIELTRKWFEKAKNDLIVANHTFFDLRPRQSEIACFHCQQAAEKALKGFLVHQKTEPPKTHDLVLLCQMCAEHHPPFRDIQEYCEELALYSVASRYPANEEILEEDALSAIQKAEKIYHFIFSLIPGINNV